MNTEKVHTHHWWRADVSMSLIRPLAEQGIVAGFPSPADDYLEQTLDLNRALIDHPESTFYGRVSGDSMRDAGIEEGDIVIIDKSITPQNGAKAVCFVDGEFTLKEIRVEENRVWLVAANPQFKPLEITESNDFLVWGVVTYVIKKM